MTSVIPSFHAATGFVSAFGAAYMYDVMGAFQGWAFVASTPLLVGAAAVMYNVGADGESEGYDVVEPVQIASDDAYDYADGLEDGRTIVEDKRDAECYLAEPRGDGDA